MERFSSRGLPLVHRLQLPVLLVVPVLFSVAAVIILGFHGDLNVPLLASQCHSHARLPGLSRIPLIGVPACSFISLFQAANDAVRSVARMGIILAFIGALLTVSLVEAARLCNARARVIRYPTIPWLAFNLFGGVLVWDLAIIPAFLRHAKVLRQQDDATRILGPDARRQDARALASRSELYAIPISVAVGFYLPSIAMLSINSATAIGIWLLFPLLVALVRIAVKAIYAKLSSKEDEPFRIESSRVSVFAVYSLPVLFSVMTHAFFIANLFADDDRKEMTRSTLKFIEIDALILGASVLYWIAVESGLVPLAVMLGVSVLFGTGAGLCQTWILREKSLAEQDDIENSQHDVVHDEAHEETPLLH
ncbi:uncharacterized protein B0I36DRAFT_362234 [Microdochium trichocladiopsis]|uniref:Uncharacterized protein n=1 Tax=Microdochium trichocladiopsis TaxID=1682393 RepID=A0A9P8YAH2_9PEZI|nr:uncharacterized protein B0I36DRAFT_362234 [Microdochium trichocladiopsis]KAH7033586.1 hypothetical protein B0I36DRAFT_362234 [Microdochium trichocladiopsis]